MSVTIGTMVIVSEVDEAGTDDDEKLFDGERLWDINYCDTAGNSVTSQCRCFTPCVTLPAKV